VHCLVLSQSTHVTDGQTDRLADRQTDRITTAILLYSASIAASCGKNRLHAYVRHVRIFVCWSKSDEFSNETGERFAQQNVSDAQSSMDNLKYKNLCILLQWYYQGNKCHGQDRGLTSLFPLFCYRLQPT